MQQGAGYTPYIKQRRDNGGTRSIKLSKKKRAPTYPLLVSNDTHTYGTLPPNLLHRQQQQQLLHLLQHRPFESRTSGLPRSDHSPD